VKEIKNYAETAIKLNNTNYKAWHVLGKWYYEVSNLNLFERTAVQIFYGGLPEASFKKSIMAFEKARSLTRNFCLNNLELARAYHKNDENAKAIIILQELQKMSNFTEDDVKIKGDAETLLKDWQ
jgi:tetratricopeptide (TPR) repeat protein